MEPVITKLKDANGAYIESGDIVRYTRAGGEELLGVVDDPGRKIKDPDWVDVVVISTGVGGDGWIMKRADAVEDLTRG